ncbi:glycoside hydrolase [Niabella ginsenosidivorans]|uniref:Glycoside hydrolase n=1 Tax=Niabella ginsenosidivorans TaxID=1176587 RepID=A0A1A9I8T7_9BACT|nr:glycoside hydrolase [Niabella ginsenosidivorans]
MLLCSAANAQPQQDPAGSAILMPDYRALISRADLVYSQPASRSEAGQPVGNGRMGSLVWTTPSQIKMQINRVDVFGSNSNSDNFYERNTDYCGGTGYVDLDFEDDVFIKDHFKQQLSCYDALSTVSGRSVAAKVLAWNEQDVMAVQVKDERTANRALLVNLRMLRMPVTLRGNHSALSALKIIGKHIVLTQTFKENDYYCSSAVVVGASDEAATAEIMNDAALRLRINSAGMGSTVYIASAASFDSTEDVTAKAIRQLEAAQQKGFEALYQSNARWWAGFWKQSFVHMTSRDGVADEIEKNYTYFLYVMASSSRGNFPVKFNGMLWATGGDARQWGGAFWGANQSCYYEALFPANHLELMEPMFNMYTHALPTFERAARQQWGSKGAYIPETVGFDGVPALPEPIAAEMRDLYLLKKPWALRSAAFMNYAFTKQPFLARWNWKHTGEWKNGRWEYVERGDGPFGPVNHIFSRGAKIAYQYWQQYEYTKNLEWLRSRAYPLLKGVAEFYRNFPNVKKGTDGLYSISHVNDNESIWDAENPVEEIAAMKGLFPVVIKAAELLNTDAAMRPVWKEFLEHLSPLPSSKDDPNRQQEPEVWVGARKSVSPVRGYAQRLPDGNTMPVWFFDLCNKGGDPQLVRIANNTFNAYFKEHSPANTIPHILSKIPAAAAVLGRADAIKYLLPNMLKGNERIHVMENRMDLSEGFYTTNIQRIGRVADALQQSLCQSAPPGPGKDPVIDVFAAWPEEWDAQFTLLCRGNFLTTAAIKDRKVAFVELLSKSGGICKVRNPWPGTRLDIYKNGKRWLRSKAAQLSLNTQEEDRIVLVPKGALPSRLPSNLF